MIRLTCASNLFPDGDTNYFLVNSVSAKRKKDKQQSFTATFQSFHNALLIRMRAFSQLP